MAKDYKVNINTNVKGENEVDDLNESLETTEKQADKTQKAIDGLGDSAKSTAGDARVLGAGAKSTGAGMTFMGGATRKATLAVRALGTAMKATGIGLVLALIGGAVETIKQSEDAMWEWERATNAFNFAMGRGLGKTGIGSIADDAERAATLTRDLISEQSGLNRLRAEAEILLDGERRVRDDISQSFGKRIRANEHLNALLDEYLTTAQIVVDKEVELANIRNANLGNAETEAELQEALAKQAETRLFVETQRSEAHLNNVNLIKEENMARQEGFERLQTIVDVMERIELLGISQTHRWQVDMDMQAETHRVRLENFDAQIEFYKDDYEVHTRLLDEKMLAEEEYALRIAEIHADLEQKKQDMAFASASNMLGALAMFAEEGTSIAKIMASAQIAISTYQAIMSSWVGVTPYTLPAHIALAVSMGVLGAAQIAAVWAVNPQTGVNSFSGQGSSPSVAQAPQLNLINPSEDSNSVLQNAVDRETDGEPVKAYVTSTDMTSQQELDRRIEQNANI